MFLCPSDPNKMEKKLYFVLYQAVSKSCRFGPRLNMFGLVEALQKDGAISKFLFSTLEPEK